MRLSLLSLSLFLSPHTVKGDTYMRCIEQTQTVQLRVLKKQRCHRVKSTAWKVLVTRPKLHSTLTRIFDNTSLIFAWGEPGGGLMNGRKSWVVLGYMPSPNTLNRRTQTPWVQTCVLHPTQPMLYSRFLGLRADQNSRRWSRSGSLSIGIWGHASIYYPRREIAGAYWVLPLAEGESAYPASGPVLGRLWQCNQWTKQFPDSHQRPWARSSLPILTADE